MTLDISCTTWSSLSTASPSTSHTHVCDTPTPLSQTGWFSAAPAFKAGHQEWRIQLLHAVNDMQLGIKTNCSVLAHTKSQSGETLVKEGRTFTWHPGQCFLRVPPLCYYQHHLLFLFLPQHCSWSSSGPMHLVLLVFVLFICIPTFDYPSCFRTEGKRVLSQLILSSSFSKSSSFTTHFCPGLCLEERQIMRLGIAGQS